MSLGPHTVVLLRAGHITDPYGNESAERDWANATRTIIDGCSVQPAGVDEYVIDREAVTTRLRAYLPGIVDVEPSDRAEWEGAQFSIDGVEPWHHPPLEHTDIILRRSEG